MSAVAIVASSKYLTRPKSVPISARESGGGFAKPRLISLQLMIARSTSSFFGTWKTEAKERMQHIAVGLRIVIFARASAVCAARPVNGCVGAVRSSISFSAFGKPSS